MGYCIGPGLLLIDSRACAKTIVYPTVIGQRRFLYPIGVNQTHSGLNSPTRYAITVMQYILLLP